MTIDRDAWRMTAPSTVPDTTAWAADHLRALGWTVVAPVNPSGAVPEVRVGQVWVSPNPAQWYARTVLDIGPSGWVWFTFPGATNDLRYPCTPDEWGRWVGWSNARPLPIPTPGAAP